MVRGIENAGFEIRDQGLSENRVFGHWSMHLVRVRSEYLLAREDVSRALPHALPASIRARIEAMVERISEAAER